MLQKWFQNIILKYKIALLAFFYFLNLNFYANLKKKNVNVLFKFWVFFNLITTETR